MEPRVASMRGFNRSVSKDKGAEMNNNSSRARLMAADFLASVAMALSIGVATSVALAGAVLLIAGQQAPETQSSAPQLPEDPS